MKDNEILQIFKSSESTKSTEFPYCQIALLPDFYLLNPANFVNQAIWQSNKYISHFTLLIPHFIS